MNPFGLELPPIGASYDTPFSASSRFPPSSYDLRSYARPQTTRNDIGKSMRPKPTRKDIRESIPKPTTNDIRKITPREDVETENNPVQPREDSYDKAHDFITRFNSWHSRKPNWSNAYLYEKKFTTPMSTKEWIKLSGELELSERDDYYPRYTFNSATSTLIIQCMPTPLHESIQFCFSSAIANDQVDLPFPARLFCVTNQEMNGFEGQYFGSIKTADLGVQIINADDRLETKMVVEVGFSEDYEALINDARLWLEGMSSVSLCVLVSFEEEPRYKCPVDDNMDEKKFKKLGFPDPRKLKPKHFHLEGRFGPAIYKGLDDEELDNKGLGNEEPDDEELGDEELGDEELGDEEPDDEELGDEELGDEEPDDEELGDEEPDDEEPDDEEPDNEEPDNDNEELKWVGKISTAFLERWKRDARTGQVKKHGRRVNLLTTRSIKFKRSDFMNTTQGDNRTISIDCKGLRKILAMKVIELAAERCRGMLLARIKKEDDLGDKDYMAP